MSIMNLYDDDRRSTWLATLPECLRSRASNLVLARVRAGEDTREAAYDATVAKLRRDLGGWGTEDADARTILAALIRHREMALDYCAWCLQWERLSPAQKDEQRAARVREYRHTYQEGEPPTEKQRAFLRRLGYQGVPRSKRHASQLIDELLKSRAA
jgi:hypothetical protein